MTAVPYLGRYHIALNGEGYILSPKRGGEKWYQKRVAPTFVNKFGSGDASYRDSTYWQFWAITNWRNGAKQLQLDDPGKYWKSSDIDVNTLNEISLSRALTSVGQVAAGVNVNALASWRNSQSWWNGSYAYRKQLTITAPAASQIPIGYPIKITEDTAALETATKVRSDRKDWRIIYNNGSSNIDLTRDYVSTTATFFGAQAAIAAGQSDSNYYIYYGYSGESTTKQPSTDAEWNSVYGFYGVTHDSNTKAIYHFREGSGTSVNDDTTNANNGSASGSPSWGTDGKFGRYMTFDRSDDWVNCGAGADFDLGSFTLEGWFYKNSSGSEQALIVKPNTADNDPAYSLYFKDGRVAARHIGSGGFAQGATALSNSTWYHLAATHDGSTLRLYVNGVLDGSSAESVPSTSSTALRIGRSTAADTIPGSGFGGRAQHLRISNSARTSFPYVLTTEPSCTQGSETTTQPSQSSADLYAGASDGKLYKHDGTTTWTEQFNTRAVTWYDTVAQADTDAPVGDDGGTEKAESQSFQIGATAQTIKGIEVYLKKNTGTPGDITVRIETDNAGVPSGTLAHANLAGTISSFATTTYGWVSCEFTTSASLSATTTYWLVLKTAAAANDNFYHWGLDTVSPTYSTGNRAYSTDGGGTWTAQAGSDFLFRVNGEATQINDLLISSVGGSRKMLIATGEITSQVNGNARLYSFDGTTYALEKIFATSVESQITKLAEFNAKLYAGVGPQGRVYEGTAPGTWTLSKDIDIPNKPGYIYAMKEYNTRLYAGGGAPELLPDRHYSGFWYVYDTTTWTSLYPFDFTEIRTFEFYDGYLFGGTYDGRLYVFDSSSLNPLFNFKELYGYNVTVLDAKLYDDKIYFFLAPQENSNETNIGVWVFDRHGMSLAHTVSGVGSYRCATVANNVLYIGTGSDGYVYKLDETKYALTGHVQTSYFDANLPSITKLYHSITVNHDPLNAGESVTIYYKFKESESWTSLGTSNTLAATTKTVNFPSGTTGKKISLKIELTTSNTATTPKVTEVITQYKLQTVRKWMWTMRLLAKKGLTLIDKTVESRTATEIRTDLETAQDLDQLVTFTDIDGTDYTVVFDAIDQSSWVTNQSDVNENELLISLLQS